MPRHLVPATKVNNAHSQLLDAFRSAPTYARRFDGANDPETVASASEDSTEAEAKAHYEELSSDSSIVYFIPLTCVYIGFVKSLKTIANIMAAHNNTTPDWDMLPFIEARAFVRKVGLKSWDEWKVWAKTDRPPNIPSCPNQVYSSEFVSFPDWMGYNGLKYNEYKVSHRPATYEFEGTVFKAVPGLRRYYAQKLKQT